MIAAVISVSYLCNALTDIVAPTAIIVNYYRISMKKSIGYIAAIIIALTAFGSSAQSLRLPADFKGHDPEMLANASSLHTLVPKVELRILPSVKSTDAVDQMASDLLDYASSFMGLRYRRGGKTPAGFDCSGFTGYVFREFGYELSSSSAAQYSDGRKVDKSEIQPGDLVFFNGRAVNGRIGHVGIAISSDPVTGVVTFIHSANGGGIKIDRTDAPYYASRFVGARRILPD